MTKFLESVAEVETAKKTLIELGWPLSPWNDYKNWDSTWLIPSLTGGDILDVGCVTSMPLVIHEHLGSIGRRVGIDLNLDYMDWKRPNAEICIGKAEAIPFPDRSFDLVTCLSVIEHGVNLSEFASEISRVLRPGGRFVITFDFWPYPKDECALGWSELFGFHADLVRNGLRVEPVDCRLGDRVIIDRYTFGCLRGSK